MTALVLARSNSERCPKKLIRPFWKLYPLIEISLQIYRHIGYEVYVCGDKLINHIAEEMRFPTITRDRESLSGESFSQVYNFLDKINDNDIMILNPCFPLIQPGTIEAVADEYLDNDFLSLITVKEIRNVVYFKNLAMNEGGVKSNSKYCDPVFEAAPAVQIFKKKIAMDIGYPYMFTRNDPYLYPIGMLEGTDVNTEDDFKVAKVLYNEFKGEE